MPGESLCANIWENQTHAKAKGNENREHTLAYVRINKIFVFVWQAGLLEAVAKSLLLSIPDALETRVIALNASTGSVLGMTWLKQSPGSVGEPFKVENHDLQAGSKPDSRLPWIESPEGTTGLRFDRKSHLTTHPLMFSRIYHFWILFQWLFEGNMNLNFHLHQKDDFNSFKFWVRILIFH